MAALIAGRRDRDCTSRDESELEFSSLNILYSKPRCANHLGAGCKSICLNLFHPAERLALKWDSLLDSEGKSVAVTWGELFRTAGVLDGIAFKCTTALELIDLTQLT